MERERCESLCSPDHEDSVARGSMRTFLNGTRYRTFGMVLNSLLVPADAICNVVSPNGLFRSDMFAKIFEGSYHCSARSLEQCS
jgi:hypothetical protein